LFVFELLNPLDDSKPYAVHWELLDDKQASIILVENFARSNATKRIRRKTNRWSALGLCYNQQLCIFESLNGTCKWSWYKNTFIHARPL